MKMEKVTRNIPDKSVLVELTMWARELTAPDEFDSYSRLLQVMYMAGTLIITPVTGILADMTGHYIVVYAMFSVMGCLIIGIVLITHRILNGSRRSETVEEPDIA